MTGRISLEGVRAYFDAEAQRPVPLLPDPNTVSGLGTYLKHLKAASLMAEPEVVNVLDVGCNRGPTEALFQSLHPDKAQKTFVEGIDISSEAIKRASALHLPNCNFRWYDGAGLPYPSETFDLVLMVEVIEHVATKEHLLQEIWRVLRPEGRLFLTTPNPDCWALKLELAMWRVLRRVFKRPLPAKDAFISPLALASTLSALGFQAETQRLMFMWPHLFVYFSGWSIAPPLPPRALYHYQKMCLKFLNQDRMPEHLRRRLNWSSVALIRKVPSTRRNPEISRVGTQSTR